MNIPNMNTITRRVLLIALEVVPAIALAHGGTVDKFVGDAILVFFGDPETLGIAEDAKACLRMAVEMQRRLVDLNAEWRARGVEHPFSVRMGIRLASRMAQMRSIPRSKSACSSSVSFWRVALYAG